ncbi:MAG: amidohydrolase family protein [Rhodococcus sp. (in: high G+C Gram-positive bacteria)]|uniref:amidohydrolase family protein n=1 Tax=Rhodococcus sp. TaxID=1831 RepID=UPI003BB14115
MSKPVTGSAGSPPPLGVIDVHTHAIGTRLPDLSALPGCWPSIELLDPHRARILLGGRPYREIDDRCWSSERRLADMDAEGVAAQVVSPIPVTLCHDQPAEGARILAAAQNDALAALIAEAPNRLYALGAVPLQDPDAAVAELSRCVDELGFLGVEIGTRVGARELADPAFDDFFAAAAERSALVLVHPVDTTLDPRTSALGLAFGLGMPMETTTAAAALLTGRPRTPGVRMCLAHGGGALPAVLPRLDRGAVLAGADGPAPSVRARDLWCDSLTYDAAALGLAIDRFGAEHVLLGSDYPFAARETPPGAVLETFSDELTAAIRHGNAAELIATVRALAGPAATRR